METQNIPAITSEQLGAITPPAAKQYFNQETNRYYTDPTGTWQPPAGWTQTGLKGGGKVRTKHFDEGDYVEDDLSSDQSAALDNLRGSSMPDEDIYSYLRSLPSDNAYLDDLAYAPLGDLTGGSDSFGYQGLDSSFGDRPEVPSGVIDNPFNPATYDPYSQTWRSTDEEGNVITYDKDGNMLGAKGPGFDKNGNPIKGAGAIAPGRNAGKVQGTSTLKLPTNIPPNVRNALLAAGLGGLLGYMGRPKGMKPMGMTGGSLGLSQSQVYNALKGKPVQRAEGGEIDGYAKGGGLHYLKSAEDGMADRIPATIDNKQPAKLSGGEFVIPADVVSHLGNGNSEAGAKQLYAMMDRIRHARTGNKKQGKQINPAKFTPK